MPVSPGARVPSETRFCQKEQVETEWRRYSLRKNRAGESEYQWRCRSCLSASDAKSKNKRREGELVSLGLVSVNDLVHMRGVDKKFVTEAWNTWVKATNRPDEKNVNSSFAQTYSRLLRKRPHEELLNVVRIASYAEPKNDTLDVKRVINTLSNENQEVYARQMSGLGNDKYVYAPRSFKYQGLRGVRSRALGH